MEAAPRWSKSYPKVKRTPGGRGAWRGGLSPRGGVARALPETEKQLEAEIRRFLLDFDARFDNFLFQAGRWSRELWERFSMFMDRFHIGGWRRWMLVEPFSEAATMGAVGLIVMLALALPAFRETADDDWLKK